MLKLDGVKSLYKESTNSLSKCKEVINNIGPYHPYDLRIFEILPSSNVDNKNNKVILESFSNLTSNSFWKPLITGRPPLGIEIYSDGVETTYHLLLPNDNLDFMINKAYSCFNGSSINKVNMDYLQTFDNQISDVYYLNIKDNPFMPFSMDISPIGNVISETMDNIQQGEKACVQVLLQPIDTDWQTKLRYDYRYYNTYNKKLPFGTNPIMYISYLMDNIVNFVCNIFSFGKTAKQNYKETIKDKDLDKLFKNKLHSSGYRTSIRVMVETKDKSKRPQISRSLMSTFNSMNKYNEFLYKGYINKKKALESTKNRKISIMDNFFISSSEAINLLSLPDKNTKATKIKRTEPTEENIPIGVSKGNIYIGNTLPYKNTTMKVCMATNSFNEINKTMICLAPPGYGKSTLNKRMAYECMKNDMGFLLIDIADGSTAIQTLNCIPPEKNNKLVWLDFSDLERPPLLGLNILEGTQRTKALLFTDWFSQLLNLGKNAPRAKALLKKFALSCFADETNNIEDFNLLVKGEPNTVKRTIEYLKTNNPSLYIWWTTVYATKEDKVLNMMEPIAIRLDELLDNQFLRSIMCSDKSNVNIRKWMDEGYGVIVNIPESNEISETEQQAIMSFLFLAFWSATLSRRDILIKNKKPRSFKLLLDEPYTYIHKSEVIEKGINKFRKYGVSINIFMHGVEQINQNSPSLWNALLDSQPNLILGGISNKSMKSLRNNFLTVTDEEYEELFSKVQNRDKHNYVINMSFDNGIVKPFVFHAAPCINKEYDKTKVIYNNKKLYAPYTQSELEAVYFSKIFNMSTEQYKKVTSSKGDVKKCKEKENSKIKEIVSGI